MQRRNILRALPITLAGFVAACATGTNPLNSAVTVDLTTAKLWANELVTAVTQFGKDALPVVGSKLSASDLTSVNNALTALTNLNASFQAVTITTTDVKGLIQQIVGFVSTVVKVLAPVYPPLAAVSTEIDIAVFVLDAFINAVAIIVPPVPAGLHKMALKHKA